MANNKRVDAIVLGCNYANTLGMVKSVGEAGYSVGLIHHTSILKKKRITPDMASGYVIKKKYIDRKNDDEMYRTLMEDFVTSGYKPVVLAADDYSASFVDRYYDELKPYFRMLQWESGKGKLTYYMEKEHQKAAAIKVGFPCAQCWTMVIPRPGEDFKLPEGIIYPCITKPEVSSGGGMSKALIDVFDNEADLYAYFKRISEEVEGTILIEEFLTIEEEYTVPGIRLEDDVIIPCFVRKLKTGQGKVRGLTVTGVNESTDTCPELLDNIKKFIYEVGLIGIFDVEIIKCKGKYYFNEINLRSSAATYGITGAGVNIAAFAIDYLLGKDWKANNREIRLGSVYINEKPALQCYIQDNYSYDEYRELIASADVHLLTGDDDEPSKQAFLAMEEWELFKKKHKNVWGIYTFYKKVRKKAKKLFFKIKRRTKRFLRKCRRFVGRRYRKARRYIYLNWLIKINKTTDSADIKAAAGLLEQTFKAAMEQGDFSFTHMENFEERYETLLAEGGSVYVAKRGKEVVGTVSYVPRTADEWYYQGDVIALRHLAVEPSYQKVGLGRQLVELIRKLAREEEKPVSLSTPEKNTVATRFYRNNGFKRVKLTRSGDHYAIRFFDWNGLEQPDLNPGDMFRKSVFSCLMRDYREIGGLSTGRKLIKRWNNDFLKYLEDQPDEIWQDMRKCYRNLGITPKEYTIFGFRYKNKKERADYLSSIAINTLVKQYEHVEAEEKIAGNRMREHTALADLFKTECLLLRETPDTSAFTEAHPKLVLKPVSRKRRKRYVLNIDTNPALAEKTLKRKKVKQRYLMEESLPYDPSMKQIIKGHVATVKAITAKKDGQVKVIMTGVEFGVGAARTGAVGAGQLFAAVNKSSGHIANKAYYIQNVGSREKYSLAKNKPLNRDLPEWEELLKILEDAALRMPNFLLGWDLAYTSKGWVICDVVRKPSFKNIQIVRDQGIAHRIENFVGQPLNKKLSL